MIEASTLSHLVDLHNIIILYSVDKVRGRRGENTLNFIWSGLNLYNFMSGYPLYESIFDGFNTQKKSLFDENDLYKTTLI